MGSSGEETNKAIKKLDLQKTIENDDIKFGGP